MRGYLAGRNQEMDKYENAELQVSEAISICGKEKSDSSIQNMARSYIPDSVMLIHNRPEHENFAFKLDDDDILALNLVRWFKESFMRWIDPIICPECGGSTEFGTTLTGNEVGQEDREFGAGRVEMHRCKSDESHPVRRFPRYK